MTIRVLEAAEVPWGDYGHMLFHGMTGHRGRAPDGRLQLERTGSYIPSITFPGVGDIVVTEAFRDDLERSGLGPVEFRPVHKTHVVSLEWQHWDRTSDLPQELPETGEPEDFVLARPHSDEAAAALGPLWELVLPVAASVARAHGEIALRLETWHSEDLFRADEVSYNYASSRAQAWLQERVGDLVAFEDFAVV